MDIWSLGYADPEQCPECGSFHTKVTKSLETTDADGNRGRWMYSIKCLEPDCGYDDDSW